MARQKDKIIYDKVKQSYLFKSNNKVVSEKQLYKIVAHEVNRYEVKQEKLAFKLTGNKISFQDWQKQSLDLVKSSHVNMARFGRGGSANTFANQYLEVGNDLRTIHYKAHRQFSKTIASGDLSKEQIISRAKAYGTATKTSFEKGNISRLMDLPVEIEGKRLLGNCKNHCGDCIGYASLDWMPIKEVTPPGVNCKCIYNCCCSIQTRIKDKLSR